MSTQMRLLHLGTCWAREDITTFYEKLFHYGGGGVARDDCCAGIAIKCNTHNSQIFSMLFSDFKVWGLRSIPRPPTVALTEWMPRQMSTHYRYHGISSLVQYGNIYVLALISILCSAADAVSLGSWFIAFKVLKLNVAILTMFLHLSNLGLGSVANFF